MTYTKLEKFHFWCQKVLPLVYDDSLSYYEVLCKTVSYLNNTMDAVNTLAESIKDYDDAIANLESEYASVNTQLTTINGLVDDLSDRVKNNEVSIESINGTISLLKSADDTLQEEIDNLELNVNNYYTTLDKKIDSLKYDIDNDTALAEIRVRVDALEKKVNNLTYDVFNYVVNDRISFDKNNWVIYEHMGNGLTSEQYCQLGLSADDYKKYDMIALDYVKFSRDLLNFDWLYLPIVGGRQSHSIGADLIANYLFQTMTADEYKQLDLDADGYAQLDKTALEYLYYPMNDDVALNPFQYMITLNNERIANEARIEALETENASLNTSLTDLQNRVTALESA